MPASRRPPRPTSRRAGNLARCMHSRLVFTNPLIQVSED
ncbi:protein of unknown function [Microbacterium sp. Nx66]|nr:protein of unknown function [Microbacterium sp. Nx66]